MSESNAQPDAQDDVPNRPARRPRYRGTHPRHFAERYKELDPESFPDMQDHVRAQGRTPAGTHIPVMLAEVLAALDPRPGETAVDCTLGHGGHAAALRERIGPEGRLIGLDIDAVQLRRTAQRLSGMIVEGEPSGRATGDEHSCKTRLHRRHFAGVGKVLAAEGLVGCDVMLADLGVSSMQIDDPSRGFSYKHDGPLDMRMDDRLTRTAADILARMPGPELAACLRELADEPHSDRIAKAIVRQRASSPIRRTSQLVRIIQEVVAARRKSPNDSGGARPPQLHPAARTFQALRILVNDEMNGLEQFLRAAPYCLNAGGRVAIISFHSGEHSRVEHALTDGLRDGLYAQISTSAIIPTREEIHTNPRARSAQLRWARKC